MIKICEFCGKEFEVSDNKHGQKKRFCNTSCSAKWRNKTFGANILSEKTRKKNAKLLSDRWKDDDFRQKKIEYMKTNNPVYQKGVVEKAKLTRLKNGGYANNFKYGNGKISKYEQIAYKILTPIGFYYNYAIPTKLAKDTFVNENYPNSYKPDFTNLKSKICIEIDGKNHSNPKQIKLDLKKDKCLEFLGFKVIRFTHKQIDDGELERWINNGKIN